MASVTPASASMPKGLGVATSSAGTGESSAANADEAGEKHEGADEDPLARAGRLSGAGTG